MTSEGIGCKLLHTSGGGGGGGGGGVHTHTCTHKHAHPTVSYLLIYPVKESPAIHMCKYSFATHWKKHKRALDIGHRGLGDSYHLHGEL